VETEVGLIEENPRIADVSLVMSQEFGAGGCAGDCGIAGGADGVHRTISIFPTVKRGISMVAMYGRTLS
jgi:hypothetical protein